MKMIMLYTLCGSADEARTIADVLIEKNAAACVNIMSPATSIYRWKGKVEESNEIPLMIKTSTDREDEAVRIIMALHSYETPAIIKWDAASVHTDYSQWMTENLKDFA
jgi:periplasmic divalent cation tolerance protein